MRLSIWNQFSSNHGTLFGVVGQFEMNEAAQTVCEVWLRLIKGVIEWRKEHPAPNFEVLTPIELEYNQRYNLQLHDVTALDWFGDDPERVLEQYDMTIFSSLVPLKKPFMGLWDLRRS